MMEKNAKRVVLITGASSGIGQACASQLFEEGYTVYGTYRSAKPNSTQYSTNQQAEAGCLKMLHMNVNDEISVRQGIQSILDVENRIDAVINCAGYALAGALEDTTVKEAKALFETNLWGIHRICREVLPTMREQRSGLIIMISSIAGQVSLPFQSFYCASKFALEAMAEALRMEVRVHGIHVVLIEPGDLSTQFTTKRHFAQNSKVDSAYSDEFEKAIEIIEYEEMHGHGPENVARIVSKILKKSYPRLRYCEGSLLQKSSIWLKKILPGKLFEWIIMKFYKVN
jgi:NADP-dependent 3-hydroxy acid dehydrogenase YdfG